ncbi:MAG: hypothetical protein R8G66_15525 [Cytophagales bacterium]|nr:hypothetical protein [Cytophagales bacterium]
MEQQAEHRLNKKGARHWHILTLWLGLAIIAGPLAIITHEGGHFFAAKTLGYSDVVLHHASIERGISPLEEESLTDRGIISFAGPLITLIMAIGCCFCIRKGNKSIFWIALGISTPLRNLASAAALIIVLAGKEVKGNDEVKVAAFFDISPVIPLLGSIAVLLFTWGYLLRILYHRKGVPGLLVVLLGIVLGNVFWLSLLGPIVLP